MDRGKPRSELPVRDMTKARRDVRLWEYEQDVIAYAIQKIDEAGADGVITTQNHATLRERFTAKQEQLAQQIGKRKKIIRLAELETAKAQLIQMYHEKIRHVDRELQNLDPEHQRVQPPARQPQASAPRVGGNLRGLDPEHQRVQPPARQPQASAPRVGGSEKSWISLRGFAVLAVIVVLLIATSTYTFGFLTNQQYFLPVSPNPPGTIPPDSSNQTTTSSSGITASLELGIYANQMRSQEVTQIDWGIVYPDDNIGYSLYLVNEGNVPCHLHLNASNWQPSSLAEQITLTWDYDSQVVEPGQGILITLSLITSPTLENVGTFAFDITITSTSMHSG